MQLNFGSLQANKSEDRSKIHKTITKRYETRSKTIILIQRVIKSSFIVIHLDYSSKKKIYIYVYNETFLR